MKNIHLVPTDRPSRLRIGDNGNFVFGIIQTSIQSKNDDFTNQHIYITSDEEIKERNWTFDGENPYKWTKDDVEDCLYNPSSENYKGCKKIILTTDEDLIKDGVQAIDDEFLEWFVKNPTCEFVPIITTIVSNSPTYKTNIGFESWRKEPKQEILEEAAEKWVFETNGHKWSNNDDSAGDNYGSFIEGAKWQAERMYSEKEVWKLLNKLNETLNIGSDLTLEQWFEQFKKK